MTGKEGECVEFGEARSFEFFHDDLCEAARLMDRMAGVISKAENPWFHSQTRLPADERLTRAQWEQVVDRQEKVLGFTGQPRIWAMHVNEATGERHLHVAWYRIDVERECAIDPGLYKNKLKFEVVAVSRKAAWIAAHRQRAAAAATSARYAERHEVDECRRLGTDVRAIRTAILDCFEQSDGGKAFKAALEDTRLDAGERRPARLLCGDRSGGRASRAEQKAYRPDLGANPRAAGRPRPQPVAERRTGAGDAGRAASRAQEPAQQAEPQPEPKHGRGAQGRRHHRPRKSGPLARRRRRSMRHGARRATPGDQPPAPRRSQRRSRSAGRSWSMSPPRKPRPASAPRVSPRPSTGRTAP